MKRLVRSLIIVAVDVVIPDMEMKDFTISFGPESVQINGWEVGNDQAMMVAIHIIEGLAERNTLKSVALTRRGDEL